jgi:hypothetical protein
MKTSLTIYVLYLHTTPMYVGTCSSGSVPDPPVTGVFHELSVPTNTFGWEVPLLKTVQNDPKIYLRSRKILEIGSPRYDGWGPSCNWVGSRTQTITMDRPYRIPPKLQTSMWLFLLKNNIPGRVTPQGFGSGSDPKPENASGPGRICHAIFW